MKFSTKEDVEAPIDFVFEQVSDFRSFERAALRRGAEVQRIDNRPGPGAGMIWDAQFKFRGRKREARVELVEFDRPNGIKADFRTSLLTGDLTVELLALSRNRTRMHVETTFEPRNLTARLLVQSVKLARTSIAQKFRFRVAHFAKDVEERHKRTS
jgi:hypothetical protein